MQEERASPEDVRVGVIRIQQRPAGVQGLKDDAVRKVRVRREEEGVAEEVFRGRREERRRVMVLLFKASHWKMKRKVDVLKFNIRARDYKNA